MDVDGFHGPPVATVSIATVLLAGAELVGEILHSGIVTRTALDDRIGELHQIGEIARTLPCGRLIAADLVLVAAVILGLALLVVPGLC